MSNKKGGRAFPGLKKTETTRFGDFDRTEQGMTLRDYFAAKAMQAMISAQVPSGDVPRYAYEVADAMLEVREEL